VTSGGTCAHGYPGHNQENMHQLGGGAEDRRGGLDRQCGGQLCLGAKALLTSKRGPLARSGEQSRYVLVLVTASIVVHRS
jgi:hypothetical protein